MINTAIVLSCLTLVAPRVHEFRSLLSGATRPDTGANVVGLNVVSVEMDAAPVALTAERVKTYIAVEHALTSYWAGHRDRWDAARATLPSGQQSGAVGFEAMPADTVIGVFTYPTLVEHDTALASFFSQHHVSPADFDSTQRAVYQAIGALNAHRPTDSTTVVGNNMVLVRAQRHALVDDWRRVTALEDALSNALNGNVKGGRLVVPMVIDQHQ